MKAKNVIHEYGLNGQHRIVCIAEDDEPSAGEWAAFTALAQHKGFLAATEYHAGDLPSGVFKVQAVAHKTITA